MLFSQQDVNDLGGMPAIGEDSDAWRNPPTETQQRAVGASYALAYDQAARFLNYVDEHVSISQARRVLDFGCGWGRMLKLLRHKSELAKVELYGCDINRNALETVRRTIPGVYLSPCGASPPSMYRDGSFGLVFAFSVFSHLREDKHLAWAEELARITEDGGHVIMTVEGANYLQMRDDLRSGKLPSTHSWHADIAATDFERSLFEAGQFQFSPTIAAQLDPSYGEAVVPRSYVERTWTAFGLSVTDWNTEHGQDWVVLRKGK